MKSYHDLLNGAFDVHIHSAPSIFKRLQTDWEVLSDAKDAGMKGIVLKSHESSTAERAFLLNEANKSVDVIGGIVLNQFVGGINPWAVEASLKMGGRFVWFPTISTSQHIAYFQSRATKLFNGDPGLSSSSTVEISKDDQITSEVMEVLHLIKEYDAVLATGHLSLKEQQLLVDKALEVGVKRILIQHADMGISRIPVQEQMEFVSKGCMIEKCYLACTDDFKDLTVQEMVKTIKYLGAESCVIGTDFGQSHNIAPVAALNEFVLRLIECNLPESDIRKILSVNAESFIY